MAQYVRPSADLVTHASWTSTPYWSKIDDGASEDNIFVTNTAPNLEWFAVDGSSVTDPASSTGHILRVRWTKGAGGGTTELTVELRQGYVSEASQGTLIATLTSSTATSSSETTYTHNLSSGEADSITDYSDLQFRISGQRQGGGTGRQIDIEFVELETPDASGGTPYDNTGGSFTITSTVDNTVNTSVMDGEGGVVSVASTVTTVHSQAMSNLGGEFTIVSSVTGAAGQFFVNLGGEVVVTSDVTNPVNVQGMEALGGVVTVPVTVDASAILAAQNLGGVAAVTAVITASAVAAMQSLGSTVGIVSILSSFQDYIPAGGPPVADIALSVGPAVERVFESEDHEDAAYSRTERPRLRSS